MPLIVIEGPEKSGKTTLANRTGLYAQERFDLEVRYVHHGVGDSTPEIIMREIAEVVYDTDKLYIFDRWYLSEYVYSELLDRKRTLDMSFEDFDKFVHTIVQNVGAYFVIDTDPEQFGALDVTDLPVDPKAERQLYDKLVLGTHWDYVEPSVHPSELLAAAYFAAYSPIAQRQRDYMAQYTPRGLRMPLVASERPSQ